MSDAADGKKEEQIKLSSLSAVECFALSYAQAVPILAKPPASRTMKERAFLNEFAVGLKQARDKMNERELNRKKQEGLRLLADKGLVELTRDGNGDYVPLKVHEEKIDRARVLVTGDWN